MNTAQVTPMMRHYLQTKEEYNDCILFYRLGDFYEMFFEDAVTVSRELELTLTGKSCGLAERAPMCGVPFHSATTYIAKLVEKGYKVAICEQVEDPKEAKGIVKRGVIRVVTPGTLIDETMLDEKKNNYLSVIFQQENSIGMVFADISTGEMYATAVAGKDSVLNEIARYAPSEIVMNPAAWDSLHETVSDRFHVRPQQQAAEFFSSYTMTEKIMTQFRVPSLAEIGLEKDSVTACAVYGMIQYLEDTQKSTVEFIDQLQVYAVTEYMGIDLATRRNLEITETMREKQKRGSLLWVLDKTRTSMGARKLKQWLEKPLLNPIAINNRLYSVQELYADMILRDDLAGILAGIYDIARILSRVALKTVSPRDMLSLRDSLLRLPELKYKLHGTKSPILSKLSKELDLMEDVRTLLENAIDDEAPIAIKDGKVIRAGYNAELDKIRAAQEDGQSWITQAEAKEREATGIKNLRIRFNKVFGYYIEVTNSNLKDVPDTYIRKQTLTNAERFITPELKEMEEMILGAGERIYAIESQLFDEIRKTVEAQTDRLKEVCEAVATVDVLVSFAEVAQKNNYTMPEMTDSGELQIRDGRHPVVEKMLRGNMFVPNDVEMNTEDARLLMITGPNMAGKSTYMRQVALITLMAQVGSFVPASYARIGIVDRIFTRVGASDDISAGQSTFMLEMVEVSNILKNATARSLVILDEIGRGTSTFDGLSIAWAVAEYMQNKRKIGAKTLFATHYHELTELEDRLEGVKNYSIAVKKRGDDITFLRKIVRGGADDSFGIEVAALAGVPQEVIRRAKEILKKIENDDMQGAYKEKAKAETPQMQMGFGDQAALEIAEELKRMDVTTFTPIEAMNTLYTLSQKAKELS